MPFKWAIYRRKFIFAFFSPPLIQDKFSQNVKSTRNPLRVPFSNKRNHKLDSPSKVANDDHHTDNYVKLSCGNVLTVREDTVDIVSIESWEEEHDYHRKLIRIPFFSLFKKWKPFYVWRRKVRSKKVHVAKESLRNSLFIASQVCDCLDQLRSRSILKMRYYTQIYYLCCHQLVSVSHSLSTLHW